MPSGIYKRTKENVENHRKIMIGKHWKVKDSSKMGTILVGKKNGMFGKKHTEESKRKNRESQLGEKSYWFGKNRSEEEKKKKSEKWKGSKNPMWGKKREKCHLWQGGKSFEKYGFDWTDLLKHSIRTRDCFVCQICKKHGWIIHHIDYDKKNCNLNNLITLCNSCHSKTNYNRNYWINYFNKLI